MVILPKILMVGELVAVKIPFLEHGIKPVLVGIETVLFINEPLFRELEFLQRNALIGFLNFAYPPLQFGRKDELLRGRWKRAEQEREK